MGRITRVATLAATALLACGTARAAEWLSLGKSDDGKQETFVDVSSIRVTGPVHRAWVKFVVAPRTMRVPGHSWWKYSMNYQAFNCEVATYRTEAASVYYDDGSMPDSVPDEAKDMKWKPVPPESEVSVEMALICGSTPK